VRGYLKRTCVAAEALLSWLETALVLSLLTATLFLAFAQVVARWLGGGWIWADELVRYLVLWLGIWGAGHATRTHKHIGIDVFTKAMPRRARLWIRHVTDLLAAMTAFLLAKASVDYIGFVGDEQSVTLGVTVGTLTWPLAAGLCWIGIRFLLVSLFGVASDGETSPGSPALRQVSSGREGVGGA